MIVTGGSVDITTYFSMKLTTGADATGLTISDFDMQYVRTRTAPVAKVDAVALGATDTAHTDNRGIEIDLTDQPGLYRFDWPDAAFAAGVKEVILSIKHTSCITEHLRVQIDPLGAPAGASLSVDISAIKTQTDKFVFTVANQVDSNIQYVNDVAVTGDGQSGTEWGP